MQVTVATLMDYMNTFMLQFIKAIYEWEAKKFKALLKHVNKKVNINENRVYVTGFSMGGQGTWIVGCDQVWDINCRHDASRSMGLRMGQSWNNLKHV